MSNNVSLLQVNWVLINYGTVPGDMSKLVLVPYTVWFDEQLFSGSRR